jgi:threonine aldolase
LIADKWAHVFNYEGGGVSFNSGVSCRLLDGNRGMITAEQVAENINPPDFYHSPLTSLVCLENTTNKGGGACYDLAEMGRIRAVCDANGLGLHLDGARIWNALVAQNKDPKDFGKIFDTISVCLSKGLGTPMGSVLLGKKSLMDKAMRVRKVLGGGMRQIGFMAAAGIYALENHLERLRDDHKRAQEIAAVLAVQPFIKKVEPTETNIVIFYLAEDVSESKFLKDLADKNVKISGMGQGKLRIVTHLDYTEAMHGEFLHLLKNYNG